MSDLSPSQAIFNQPEAFGHQKIVFCSDPHTGLKAIIAIHDTITWACFERYQNVANKTEANATINNETINKLKCVIIAGAANNQLDDEKLRGRRLVKKRGSVRARLCN